MTGRPRALLIAPTLPAEGGSGLGIRAGMILEALAVDHDVSLLVVPVTGTVPPTGVSPFVDRLTVRATIADLSGLRTDSHLAMIARVREPAAREEALRAFPRPLLTGVATRDAVAAVTAPLASVPFDLVLVMRLHLAPFAAPWLEAPNRSRRPRCVIDVDDDEVRTHQSLAALHEARGDATAASRATREAQRYARFEQEYLPRFDRVLMGTPADQAAIQARLALETVRAVPNAVRLPMAALGPRPAAWQLLFVGSLGYAPNADAVDVLCHQVLPRLRAAAQHAVEVEVEIVGTRPGPDVARLAGLPGVRVAADVPSVAPHYARCRLAVAPIRAGGSTRIKILEAFAHRRPVVSTRLGAEGLDALDGVHLLLADEPADFAESCLRLLRDDELAERLVASSTDLVATRFALPVMAKRIADLCREILGR
jgi:glycosyltransferase involved in cell wall biosynthesis